MWTSQFVPVKFVFKVLLAGASELNNKNYCADKLLSTVTIE